MNTSVQCSVNPTEDIERVKRAIESNLGKIKLDKIENEAFCTLVSSNIDRSNISITRQMIHDKRIISAVRQQLLKNYNDLDCSTTLYLDKQAAYLGKIRLIDYLDQNTPLGSIKLQFNFKNHTHFNDFLDWFSPRTKDGKIVT
ncbi:MAG: hypothetical protein JW779_09910 [Candidatus Thorarchaeota archaeon]|nr:hypothetical protein [Candidatus Thorarchaeota archaeon]